MSKAKVKAKQRAKTGRAPSKTARSNAGARATAVAQEIPARRSSLRYARGLRSATPSDLPFVAWRLGTLRPGGMAFARLMLRKTNGTTAALRKLI